MERKIHLETDPERPNGTSVTNSYSSVFYFFNLKYTFLPSPFTPENSWAPVLMLLSASASTADKTLFSIDKSLQKIQTNPSDIQPVLLLPLNGSRSVHSVAPHPNRCSNKRTNMSAHIQSTSGSFICFTFSIWLRGWSLSQHVSGWVTVMHAGP